MAKRYEGCFGGNGNVLLFFCDGCFTTIIEAYQNVLLKQTQFIIHKLFLNEIDLKISFAYLETTNSIHPRYPTEHFSLFNHVSNMWAE